MKKSRDNVPSPAHVCARLVTIALLAGVVLALFSTRGFAQDDKYSFRLRGMGEGLYGFIDDLYSDLSLNPAYIHRYKGNWLYTNLSNLQGGDDARTLNQNLTLFRDFDLSPNNLVGTVTDRFGTPFGIFVETRGIDFLSHETTTDEQFQTLTSGAFTRQTKIVDTENAGQSVSLIGIVRGVGVSLSLHRNDIGIHFEDETATSRFAIDEITELRENTASVTAKTVQRFEFPNSLIGFSVGKIVKRDNREISLAAGRRPERNAFNDNDILSLFKEPFLNGFAEKFDILGTQTTDFFTKGMRSLFINARMKNIYPSLSDLQQHSFFINYTRYTLPVDIETSGGTILDSLATAGADRKNILLTRNGVSVTDGSGTINRVEAGAGVERFFSSMNTLVGFGAKLDYVWGNLDVAFHPSRIEENLDITVEVGDPAEEAGSYNRIINDKKDGILKSDISGTVLSFPVGIETRLSDKVTLRMGARPVFSLQYKNELQSRDTDKPDELVETNEDVTTFVPADGPGSEAAVANNIERKNANFNSYHFGASIHVNESVTIDLLHFSQLTELDTWWLSLVIKY